MENEVHGDFCVFMGTFIHRACIVVTYAADRIASRSYLYHSIPSDTPLADGGAASVRVCRVSSPDPPVRPGQQVSAGSCQTHRVPGTGHQGDGEHYITPRG